MSESMPDPEAQQKQRIKAILATGAGDPDQRWEAHLKQHLTLPLQVEVYDGFNYDYGPVQIGDVFDATGFCPLDDNTFGEVVRVQAEKGRFELPLGDLRPTDKSNPAYQLIEDYAVWLSEYRDLEPEYW